MMYRKRAHIETSTFLTGFGKKTRPMDSLWSESFNLYARRLSCRSRQVDILDVCLSSMSSQNKEKGQHDVTRQQRVMRNVQVEGTMNHRLRARIAVKLEVCIYFTIFD